MASFTTTHTFLPALGCRVNANINSLWPHPQQIKEGLGHKWLPVAWVLSYSLHLTSAMFPGTGSLQGHVCCGKRTHQPQIKLLHTASHSHTHTHTHTTQEQHNSAIRPQRVQVGAPAGGIMVVLVRSWGKLPGHQQWPEASVTNGNTTLL